MTAERCRAEIAWREARLRSGDPIEMEGVLQGLQDWSAELRELESLPAAACVPLALQKRAPLAYYNEFDPKAAAWLRELIKAGLIAKGDVDERSISDVRGSDLAVYTQCHFFAGIGGWSYALRLAGWPDDRPVWTGSCPCQPFSAAGKQAGEKDERHLWPDFWRLIADRSPNAVFGEQVANSIGFGWIDGVRADVETKAYALGVAVLGSHSVGAPHIRQRLYWVANARHEREGRPASARQAETGRPLGDAAGRRIGCAHCNSTGRFQNGNKCYCCDGRGWRDIGWLGDTAQRGIGTLDRQSRARPRQEIALGGSGLSSGMAVSDGRKSSDRDLQRSGEYGQQPEDSGTRGMANTECDGRWADKQEREAQGRATDGRPGFWDDFDVIHCTDGKARRIEPGTFPLAHGIPARMGRLRGYGNAITPEVAAEFIGAYMDVQNDVVLQGDRLGAAAGKSECLMADAGGESQR